MNDPAWQKVEELFAAALELPAARRRDFLARRCGGDAVLQAELARAWPELRVLATVGDGASAVKQALALLLVPASVFIAFMLPADRSAAPGVACPGGRAPGAGSGAIPDTLPVGSGDDLEIVSKAKAPKAKAPPEKKRPVGIFVGIGVSLVFFLQKARNFAGFFV